MQKAKTPTREALTNVDDITWLHASDAAKLATCRDFLALARDRGHLNARMARNVRTAMGLRHWAGLLAKALDDAYADDAFGQTVAELAAKVMDAKGWR